MTHLPHGWPDGLPDPHLADLDGAAWWELTAEHRLCVQRCTACGATRFPPRPICHRCASPSWSWQDIGPGGEIYSLCEPHYAAHPSLRERGPYVVVLVTPDGSGGERVVGNLLDGPVPNPLNLIGRRVTCAFEPIADQYVLPQWRLTDEGDAP